MSLRRHQQQASSTRLCTRVGGREITRYVVLVRIYARVLAINVRFELDERKRVINDLRPALAFRYPIRKRNQSREYHQRAMNCQAVVIPPDAMQTPHHFSSTARVDSHAPLIRRVGAFEFKLRMRARKSAAVFVDTVRIDGRFPFWHALSHTTHVRSRREEKHSRDQKHNRVHF